MKKIIVSITLGAVMLYAGDFYLYKQYYMLGFEKAEQQYRKMLIKEGLASYDMKTGEWKISQKIDRDTSDLESLAYSLETELSLVRSQIEAQHIDHKKAKK